MHPALFFESFFFCSRNNLERLQPLSRSLLNMIANGSKVLPLRSIDRVDMDCWDPEDVILIYVVEWCNMQPDYEASIHADFAEIFLRLQNTCIKRFCVAICDSPFLRYWNAQETASFTVLRIDFHLPGSMNYVVLDFIMNHLRPKTTACVEIDESSWQYNGYNSEHLQLLARDSFRNNLQTCRLDVDGNAFPPPAFFLNERGYSNYELACYDANVADGVDGLIEGFIRDGCANMKLQSVYIKCGEWGEDRSSPAPKQLIKPTEIDMPIPKIDSTSWLTCDDDHHQVSQCEIHSFVNTKQWKQMEVYKWTVEYDGGYCPGGGCFRNTTYILHCRVKNL